MMKAVDAAARSDAERVVITGMGVISPNGVGVDAFWKNCVRGKSGVVRINEFDVSRFASQIAGVVRDFDPDTFDISESQKESLDRYALFALAAAEEAVRNSGLDNGDYDPDNMGVCIATAIAGTKFMEEEFLRLTNKGANSLDSSQASPHLFLGASFHVASAEVAKRYGARGPVLTLATGCTAGLDALGQAVDLIRSGQSKIMIAGATEAPITPIAFAAFDIIGALASDRNDQPEKASRPYDRSRSGFVLGEGCGIFVLESLEHANARGATVLAEVLGFGSTCNAYHMTDLAPEGIDLHRAMKQALSDARLQPEAIDHVNAHGSSTPQNDVNESNAVKHTLGRRAYEIPITSIKSIIGHALSAANAVELVCAVLSLIHQKIPPTINYEHPDPHCDLTYATEGACDAKIDFILKDASGFSGIHSAIVLGKLRDRAPGRAA
ncbi:MAG: beta-ketoacyl-[acyl-carrier-protein] synthase family protein [Methylocystis sp.]|uniref:beta-ketoacyl-[acyl-carrier-protein] synthase family protein n=1 Tax=Methylocystis sp. TaxID=1911079 RepID=UPI00393BCE65